MILRIKRRILKNFFYLITSLVFLCIFLAALSLEGNFVIGTNITNVTVTAKVNVTNTEPYLYLVRITNPATPIDLTAGGVTVVTCNGSASDVNGYTDITNVSATFYQVEVGSGAINDNNTHYINSSCGNCSAVPGTNNQNASCLCQFPIQYYANPGTWQCNMTINDSGGLPSFYNSSYVTVNEVLGIGVENLTLDYGSLAVTQISPAIRKNVTNLGNIPINVSVRSFGGGDEDIGINLTMICELGTNITFGYQRYYPFDSSINFGSMINITNQSRQIVNFTLPQRNDDWTYGNSSNSTFWKLQVPSQAAGICNGTIVFRAISAIP